MKSFKNKVLATFYRYYDFISLKMKQLISVSLYLFANFKKMINRIIVRNRLKNNRVRLSLKIILRMNVTQLIVMIQSIILY